MGTREYVRSVTLSDAQILCSTLTTALRDELRNAGTVEVDGAGRITRMFSSSMGEVSGFSVDGESGQVMLGDYNLLSNSAYPHGLRTDLKVTYVAEKDVFSVELKILNTAGKTCAANEFEIRKINSN